MESRCKSALSTSSYGVQRGSARYRFQLHAPRLLVMSMRLLVMCLVYICSAGRGHRFPRVHHVSTSGTQKRVNSRWRRIYRARVVGTRSWTCQSSSRLKRTRGFQPIPHSCAGAVTARCRFRSTHREARRPASRARVAAQRGLRARRSPFSWPDSNATSSHEGTTPLRTAPEQRIGFCATPAMTPHRRVL
jgi:hypothetical protein